MTDVVVSLETNAVQVNFGTFDNVSGGASLTTANRVVKVSSLGIVTQDTKLAVAAGVVTGAVSLQADSSAGLTIKSMSGADIVVLGPGSGQSAAFADGISAVGTIQTRPAATQDGVAIVGRAGGTGTYLSSITTAALTASRTWTLPDRSDTVAGLGAQTFTGAQQFPAGSATVPSVALGVATDGFGRFATGVVSLLVASEERIRFQSDRLSIKANARAWYSPGITNLGLHGLAFYGADGTTCVLGASTVANDTRFIGRRANGTALVPTALGSGDDILNIQASGYDGTAFTPDCARITAEAAGAWSFTAHGTRWRFFVTAAGATALSEAFQINSTGQALCSNGTEALPGISFLSEPDCGLYRIGENAVGLSTAGTLALSVSATQQVSVPATTASTSTTTGALIVGGGVGIAGDTNVGGRVTEDGTFAGIHVHDASTAQTIPTGTTYTKSTAFTDNGFASNCTPDAANDKITITKPGLYRVEGSFSFTCGTNNVVWKGSAFLGGVEQDNVHWERKVATGADLGNAGFTGIIDVTTANTDLDFRVRHNQAGNVDLTITYANLNVSYLGET